METGPPEAATAMAAGFGSATSGAVVSAADTPDDTARFRLVELLSRG